MLPTFLGISFLLLVARAYSTEKCLKSIDEVCYYFVVPRHCTRIVLYHSDVLVYEGDEKVYNNEDHGHEISQEKHCSFCPMLGSHRREIELPQECRN